MANYNAVNAMANQAAANPFQTYSSDPNKFVAQMNQTQLNAMGPLNVEQYENPYINDVVKSTMDVVNQQNQQAQAGQLGTAISSGAFGGDRSGIAAANLAQQQQIANAQISSQLYSDAYNQALAAAQQQQGFQFAAGTLQQQTDQAGLTALYNQWLQQQAYPFQTAQFLGNIAMGTGALSGSTTTTTQPYSYFERGGTVREHRAEGGVAGPYGAGVGSLPGMQSYVPDPYLPVGQLMIADPSLADMAQQSAIDYANKIAEFGNSIDQTFFADGGVVDPRGYLGPVLDAQEKDRHELRPADTPSGKQSSGLGDILKIAAMFMSRGGYADGGGPDWERYGRTGNPSHMDQAVADSMLNDTFGSYTGSSENGADVAAGPRRYVFGVIPIGQNEAPDPAAAPKPGLVPDNPDLTTNATQPLPPVKDMGEIAPAPQIGLGTAKMPDTAPQSGVAIPRGGMAEHIMDTFVSAGLPTKVAGGILMNINSESGINPSAIGDNGDSYGFVQLNKGRKDAYIAAANEAGVDPADPTFQSNYIVNDLQTNYPSVYRAMMEAPDAGTAAVIFMDGYEKPGKQYRDQRAMQYTGGNMPISDVGLGAANTSTAPASAPVPGVNPAYDERNALGQIFYNPRTNKLDKNALLALLGGIGTMASSPSRFLGSAILQGLGGFANTYAGLQKQQADIASTIATAGQTTATTADIYNKMWRSNVYESADGRIIYRLPNGQIVPLSEVMSNPQTYGVTPEQIQSMPDDYLGKIIEKYGVDQGDMSRAVKSDISASNSSQHSDVVKQSSDIINSTRSAAVAAQEGMPITITQAVAVSKMGGSSGAIANVQSTVDAYINKGASIIGLTPWSSIPADQQVAQKSAIINAMLQSGQIDNAGFETIQLALEAQPSIEKQAEANASIMAFIITSQKKNIDKAEFVNMYANEPGNYEHIVNSAPTLFAQGTTGQYSEDQKIIEKIIIKGSSTPKGWSASPIDIITSGNYSNDYKRYAISQLGYNDQQVGRILNYFTFGG